MVVLPSLSSSSPAEAEAVAPVRFKQTMLVEYRIDGKYTVGAEPYGDRLGLVLSIDKLNQSTANNLLICPLIRAVDKNNAIWGIQDKTNGGFFRPDMCTSIGKEFARPAQRADGSVVFYSPTFTQIIATRFLNLLSPVYDTDPSAHFLNKGNAAWFTSLPYANKTSVARPGIGVILSPAAVADRTGLAIVFRGSDSLLRYLPHNHTAFAHDGFAPTYIKSNDFVCCSIERLNLRPPAPPALLTLEEMEEFHDKLRGAFDPRHSRALTQKYPGRPGTIPERIRQANALRR